MIPAKDLKVVCVSLGGTKIEIGALTQDYRFLSSTKLYWRKEPSFEESLGALSSKIFCTSVAGIIVDFLKKYGYDISDVSILGIAFPGPCWDRLWYSNNLTPAFRNGVMLHDEMINALSLLAPFNYIPEISIIFDAQCDAGGELYHHAGHFYNERNVSASVINVATGIAAGFIHNGRVLINNEDFRSFINNKYDCGAGQLGRHLWYYPDIGRWQYHFCPQGKTPKIDPPSVRMTERLSGPALAGRLLYRLGRADCLNALDSDDIGIEFSELKMIWEEIANKDPENDTATVTRILRQASIPVSSAILRWANGMLTKTSSDIVYVKSCINKFAEDIIEEFANVLRVWMAAPGWKDVSQRIVLTGGIGIHFLESLDPEPAISFCSMLKKWLPVNVQIERSRLTSAAERECYIFCHQ